MRLTSFFAMALGTTSALCSVLPERRFDINKPECVAAEKDMGLYQGKNSQACAELVNYCAGQATYSTWIWSKTSCVAAATCHGSKNTHLLAQCANDNVLPRQSTPALSKNVYKNIVGSCADSGCPITQQKYIDWFYGALSATNTAMNTTTWPENGQFVVDNFWKPMKTWTNTGETIPYANFNDFLHYADLVCSELATLTRDQTLWVERLQDWRRTGQIPLHDHRSTRESSAETSVLDAYRRCKLWPKPRRTQRRYTLLSQDPAEYEPPKPNIRPAHEPLTSLHIVLDRYLVVVYVGGLLLGYDMKGAHPSHPRLRYMMEEAVCTSTAAGYDSTSNCLVVCLTCDLGPSTVSTVVHIILPHMQVVSTMRIMHFAPEIVQHIDTKEKMILFSRSSSSVAYSYYGDDSIQTVYGTSDDDDDNEFEIESTRNTELEDLADLWNGVLAVSNVTGHDSILIFRHHSVELHSLNLRKPFPMQKHEIQGSFRSVSLSSQHLEGKAEDGQESIHSVVALAYDVYRGLHKYLIRIFMHEEPPRVVVDLEQVYVLQTDTSRFQTGLPIITALALGHTGKRAVWVERARGITLRMVKVWPACSSLTDDGEWEDEPCRDTQSAGRSEVPLGRSAIIHEVPSYSLMDDVLLIALAEVDGTIVMGSRDGQVTVLELDVPPS